MPVPDNTLPAAELGLTVEGAAADPVALLLADKRSPATRRAYAGDLAAFFAFLGHPAPQAAGVLAFASLPVQEVALHLARFKAALMEKGLSEATVNRRLAAVRSLLKMCCRMGFAKTDGRGLVDSEKVTAYRDTRGVGIRELKRLVATPGTDTLRGLRDTAILRLLCENALRRAEACSLSVGDFEYTDRRLRITGKGKGTQRIPITLSVKCADAIAAYLVAAGHAADAKAPLFQNADHRPGHAGGALTSDGLYYLVDHYGSRAGLKLTPHKLRHSSITAALDATNGDVRKVQRLSRHADIRTLSLYDDNRTDMQGEVTGLLSGLI
jgi:integrase/recombinase XerC